MNSLIRFFAVLSFFKFKFYTTSGDVEYTYSFAALCNKPYDSHNELNTKSRVKVDEASAGMKL